MVSASQLQAEIDALSAAILKAYQNGGITDYITDGNSVRRVSVEVLEKLRRGKQAELDTLATPGGGVNLVAFPRRF